VRLPQVVLAARYEQTILEWARTITAYLELDRPAPADAENPLSRRARPSSGRPASPTRAEMQIESFCMSPTPE
jgi:hypothetical protein